MEFIKANWPAPPSIHAFTTTRLNGISPPPYHGFNLATHVGDELNNVITNRLALQKKLLLPNQPVWLSQTHSTVTIDAALAKEIPSADASYTDQPHIVCAILTADCLPLLICDRAGTVVSAVHAGWRGLANGVIEAAINALPVKPADLIVWLGPAISAEVFEVGADVVSAFTQHDAEAVDAFVSIDATHWLCSLNKLAKMRLARLGVTQVYGGDRCTYTEKNLFYSFRREGKTGRIATLIWRDMKHDNKID